MTIAEYCSGDTHIQLINLFPRGKDFTHYYKNDTCSTMKDIFNLRYHNIISYYIGTCLIQQTKEPGKCVGLYRMSEYSRF